MASVNGCRIHAVERSGQWLAYAERVGSGERFGLECAGTSEADAVGRLARWLDWQSEHAAALAALQAAERAYHRIVAGGAFSRPADGARMLALQRESLELLGAACLRLDDIRGRQPA
jgi:hypothetical protein